MKEISYLVPVKQKHTSISFQIRKHAFKYARRSLFYENIINWHCAWLIRGNYQGNFNKASLYWSPFNCHILTHQARINDQYFQLKCKENPANLIKCRLPSRQMWNFSRFFETSSNLSVNMSLRGVSSIPRCLVSGARHMFEMVGKWVPTERIKEKCGKRWLIRRKCYSIFIISSQSKVIALKVM